MPAFRAPYRYAPQSDSDGEAIGTDHFVLDADGKEICTAPDEATGRLFAAAPKLLTAAREGLRLGEIAVRAGLSGWTQEEEDAIVLDHVDLKMIRAALVEAHCEPVPADIDGWDSSADDTRDESAVAPNMPEPKAMTTLERIEQLKRKRKAELVAQKQRAELERREAEKQEQMRFIADVHAALRFVGAEPLMEFFAPAAPREEWVSEETSRRNTLARFEIPGHNPIHFGLEWRVSNWMAPRPEDTDSLWCAEIDRLHPGKKVWCVTLADALIAAEMNPSPDLDGDIPL